jgi:GT2 family glycosyltransferase
MWTMSEYSDLALLEEAPEDENFSENPHFSCFMVKSDFFKNVGKFDENFMPAYLEDGDMHARLALNNQKCYIYGGARFYHFGSRTIKSDQEEWNKNTITFPKNQEYFLKKWGHPPVNEVDEMRKVYFKTPFNK